MSSGPTPNAGAPSAAHGHPVPLRILMGTWVALVVFTALTVAATKLDLGSLNILIALGIAVVKATLVALFFMHLRWDRPFHSIVFVTGALFVMLFISFVLIDTKESHSGLIAGYAPEIAPGARLASAAPGGGSALAGAAHGKELYQLTCVPCHGMEAEGKLELKSPALHQQEAWYVAAQLEKFRKGIRGTDPRDITGAQMRPMAMTLPDEQAVRDIAAYITGLEGPPPVHAVAGDPAAGKTLYRVCMICHGEDGRGKRGLGSPALAGQNDWYLVAQLEKFREVIRGAHPEDVHGQEMRPMVLTLGTDQAVRDVTAYIATLSGATN